jgi:negative regulator of flagellin synthesis FlgM
MTLKIDRSIKSTTGSGTKVTQTRQGRASGTGNTSQNEQTSARDEVKITSLSSQLQALESSLSGVEIADTARVDSIKAAISEGRFQINSDVVADRLLKAVKELLVKQKD